ncbi:MULTISPECIES: DNRLRE domain-containing protein [unclassified Nocardiopsis]|uniref:DNRLRE domain-containing protein n=1 Tax=unclassified Nocardiopsis TaxID=2649073 RepID=UPI00093B07B1|nr:DNRLRE domain-containing protein [Nocardiopsis sp. TSRI0078]
MRRSLTRATAVCAAYALVVSLGGAAPAAADEEASAAIDGAAVSEGRGAPGERSGEPGRTASVEGGPRDPAGSDGPSVADGSPAPVRSGDGRTEAGSSLWTYVDRAFPDRFYGDAETASVGTGRLVWDRVYTRRALFRFPVALGPGTVVDSAVLRTEVVWSYDCDSDSSMQLHRVDPFDGGATWNDQPAVRALLDTRRVRGGRAACPVSDGVEFDVTEAYQWAVDNGEPHIHLRLGERDESGTTAWRRFDVADDPPVLVVDHSTPPAPGAASGPTGPPGDSRDGAADAGPPGGRAVVHGEGPPDLPLTRSAGGPALPGGTVPGAGGTDDVRVQGLVSVGRLRAGGERVRFQREERADRLTAPGGRRRQDGDAAPRARGPPSTTPVGDRTPVDRPRGTG